MKTKYLFVLFIVALIAAACAPVITSIQPANPNAAINAPASIPVTGKSVIETTQNTKTYLSEKLHSTCASEDSSRQADCIEQRSGVNIFSSNTNPDRDVQEAYPNPALHNACASDNELRQDDCTE